MRSFRVPGKLPGWLAMLVLASACASPPEVIKLYEDPDGKRSGYERLFVVAVTEDADQRVALEMQILARLRERNVDAVASHTVLNRDNELLQEDLDRAVAEASADGLLISHIASVETSVEQQPDREELLSECRGGDPIDFFLYDHKVIKVPGTVRLAHTVVVITSFLDAATGSRVWTIQSTCFRKADINEALLEESDAIVRQLAIDGLI